MQAFPSLSAALMMLCRTTAVSLWQVCKWEPQQTALGPDHRGCQKQDGRRGDREHTEDGGGGREGEGEGVGIHTRYSSPSSQKAGYNIQLRISPSTPGCRHE